MRKSGAAALMLAGGCIFASAALGQEIHLKTRTIPTPRQIVGVDVVDPAIVNPGAGDIRPLTRGTQKTVHQIVQFAHPPGVDDLDALLLDGAQVTGALPDNAVVVSAPGELSRRPGGVAWIGRLEAQDKISPVLTGDLGFGGDSGSFAIVEFHSDVDLAQQSAVEGELGAAFLRPSGLLPQHVIVHATEAELKILAERDEVAYIFPADPALLTGAEMSACAGMLTTAGSVAQYANIMHGWDLDADHIAHLKYFFGSLTSKVPGLTVQAEIVRAFSEWASKANVTFQPTTLASAARDIYVEFVSGAHGDAYPFDGSGGVLAHTFYPAPVNGESIAGDMHFDADERWNVGGDIDIYSVALHEAGHAIGLSHSDKPGDVMYPYYRRGMALSANDIGAARELYGAAGSPSIPVTSTVTPATPGPTQPALTPLALTVDPVPSATQAATINVTGTATGGAAPDSVQWQTDHGYSGSGVITKSGAWTAGNIQLVMGSNTITLTEFDAANQASTQVATVTKVLPSGANCTPVAIAIASPASKVVTVTTPTLSVCGTASGGAGITQITWQTSNGATGIASGADHWVATGIPLLQGTTTIMLRAFDAKGASAWVSLVAVRR